MDPLTAAMISQGIAALFELWRMNAGKPEGWKPTAQDWDDLLALNSKTPDDYKAEAAARLGIPWPPAK